MLKKSNSVQKTLFLIAIFLLIAGDDLLDAIGVWSEERVLFGSIFVCLLGIFLFREKDNEE